MVSNAATVRMVGTQGLPNVATAVVGGQTDAAVVPTPFGAPLLAKGEVNLVSAMSPTWRRGRSASPGPPPRAPTTAPTWCAASSPATAWACTMITRPSPGARRDPSRWPNRARYSRHHRQERQTPAQIASGISYIDPEGRIDARDIKHQIEWYRAQGMIKGAVDGNTLADTLIDKRYTPVLP